MDQGYSRTAAPKDTTMTQREINLGFMSMRHAALPERCAAAARAGFNGVSLRADQWQQLRDDGWDGPRIQALLAEHGLRVSEIEPLRLMRDDLLQAVEEMVRAFGAPRVQVTPPLDGKPVVMDSAARWLRDVAARLPDTELAIEFLPPTCVPDVAAAQRLIGMAGGAPNLGLCVDTWHVFRGDGLASLAGIDPQRVFMIQINDGPLQPTVTDYIDDCIRFRVPCGEGEFDLSGFLRMLPLSVPVNVEVINTELDKRDPAEVARLLYGTTAATLLRCGCR